MSLITTHDAALSTGHNRDGVMDKRTFRRTPLQINGKCTFPDTQDSHCHRCMLMDVSPAGIGLLMAYPQPVNADCKIVVEFPIQCKTTRAEVDLRWARPLSENSSYNWAVGGLWSVIDETDKQVLMDYAAENMASTQVQAEYIKTML